MTLYVHDATALVLPVQSTAATIVSAPASATEDTTVSVEVSDSSLVSTVTWGGESRSFTTPDATHIEFTASRGGLAYGDNTLELDGGSSATIALNPPSGEAYVDVAGYTSGQEGSIFNDLDGDPVDGDQCWYESVADSGASVTVDSEGIVTVDATSGVHNFDAQMWDASDSTWGNVETVTVDATQTRTASGTVPLSGLSVSGVASRTVVHNADGDIALSVTVSGTAKRIRTYAGVPVSEEIDVTFEQTEVVDVTW